MKRNDITTGIGSLPHHNVDSALAYSFRHDIPFLPQLPMMNKKEFMIQQALGHLPGIEINEKSEAVINLKEWLKGKDRYAEKLNRAVELESFEDFPVLPDLYSCWRPFLFECNEREVKKVKIQMAGPLSCQIVSKLADGDSIKDYPELLSQCFKTVLVQSMSFVHELKSQGLEVVFFIDEPGLYTLGSLDPLQLTGFEDLRIMIMTLKKMGAQVGIHCCANTDWKRVLALPLDLISYDVHLSHQSLFQHKAEIFDYIKQGGGFSLGLIPTGHNSQIPPASMVDAMADGLKDFFSQEKDLLNCFVEKFILSAACGLAMKGADEAEAIFSDLEESRQHFLSL